MSKSTLEEDEINLKSFKTEPLSESQEEGRRFSRINRWAAQERIPSKNNTRQTFKIVHANALYCEIVVKAGITIYIDLVNIQSHPSLSSELTLSTTRKLEDFVSAKEFCMFWLDYIRGEDR
jgi:hypothetical protein